MPESKPRKKTSSAAQPASAAQAYKPNAVWFKPVMFGLMIIGLLWIITFYISEGRFPGPGLGVVEHRGRLRHRHHRLPDDHALALLTLARRHQHDPRCRPHEDGTILGDDGLARPPWASVDPLLREYYDTEWGLPVRDEQGLYERISLEGFQAGLSWATILRKRPAFRAAFHNFHPDTVAAFTEADVERLLQDPGIVRNRLKIRAAITNAQATVALRERGGLVDFVWQFQPAPRPSRPAHADIPTQSPESVALSKALRKQGFSFVGPTTMFALMEAIGMVDTHLLASHRRGSSGIWPA